MELDSSSDEYDDIYTYKYEYPPRKHIYTSLENLEIMESHDSEEYVTNSLNNSHDNPHNNSHDNSQNINDSYYSKGHLKKSYSEKLRESIKIGPSDSEPADFDIKYRLGHGRYGDVYVCTKDNNTYAIKIMDMDNLCKQIKHTDPIKSISTEITILSLYSHPNIVKMYEWFNDEKSIYLIMEHSPHTDLYKYTNKMADIVHPKLIISYMEQLWNCMIFLRNNNIIHRDIKPENILVFDNGKTIKLADFGMSYIIVNKNPSGSTIGTLYYISPEVILKKEHDCSSDLWSTGILFYELLTGSVPHGHLDDSGEISQCIADNNINLIIDVESQFNMQCLNIIIEILNYVPSDRPSLEYCLKSLEKCKNLTKYVYFRANMYRKNGEYYYQKYNTF